MKYVTITAGACALSLLLGLVLGVQICKSGAYVPIAAVQRHEDGSLSLPAQTEIDRIVIDMHCWISPDVAWKRVRLELENDSGNDDHQKLFNHVYRCLWESTPITTSGPTDVTGSIELFLRNGTKLRIDTHRYHDLSVDDGSGQVFVFDAWGLETKLRHNGRIMSD